MVAPSSRIAVCTVARVGRNRFSGSSESSERSHAVGIIITETYRLNPRTPFGKLSAARIVAVAGGVPLCVRHRGGQVVCGAVDCGGHISGGICHRGCGIAATIRSGLNHPGGGVAASVGGRYSGVIRLREGKAIHTHGFCGDVAGGQGVVGLAFRSVMILYPLRGSQVSFVNC